MASTAEQVVRKGSQVPAFGTGRHRMLAWGGLALALVVAVSGWAAAAYLYYVTLPDVANAHKVAFTLELVDRFGESPAHRVYMKLSDDMKPWWDSIEPMQRSIAAATDDAEREKLIARRDETLITFIHDHYLTNQIDLLIGSFAQFNRCLAVNACDEDMVRKTISIDVKRIYRTFRPYIESVRASGKPGADDFGRDLEDLYFRLVG